MTDTKALAPINVNLALPVQRVEVVQQILVANQQALEAAILPGSGLKLDIVISAALNQVAASPKLWECDGNSILQSVRESVECGLSLIKALQMAFLIDRWNPAKRGKECTCLIGRSGWVQLMFRGCAVTSINSQPVYEGEEFADNRATGEIVHKTNWRAIRDKAHLLGTYARATMDGGGIVYRTCSIAEIEHVKNLTEEGIRRKIPDYAGSPAWKNYYEEMALKLPIVRLRKTIPIRTEFQDMMTKALAMDGRAMDIDLMAPAPAASPQTLKANLESVLEGSAEVKPPAQAQEPAKPAAVTADQQAIYDHMRALSPAGDEQAQKRLYVEAVKKTGADRVKPEEQTPADAAKVLAWLKAAAATKGADVAPFLAGGPEHKVLEIK